MDVEVQRQLWSWRTWIYVSTDAACTRRPARATAQGDQASPGSSASSRRDAMGQIITDWTVKAGALLLGRTTYQIFAAHWPPVPADDPVTRTWPGVASGNRSGPQKMEPPVKDTLGRTPGGYAECVPRPRRDLTTSEKRHLHSLEGRIGRLESRATGHAPRVGGTGRGGRPGGRGARARRVPPSSCGSPATDPSEPRGAERSAVKSARGPLRFSVAECMVHLGTGAARAGSATSGQSPRRA